ncbi:efflux RND transporter permease subunit [Dasania marina]|uniref:efflux RND transporter permease subunit n=1 Tax=Dasania marina TaxID=471499 RepID=UPI0030DC1145|tara:strand:+ start:9940 stop:12996 length:3057 start_codon:yes stop_codon:yes gene_type:complete
MEWLTRIGLEKPRLTLFVMLGLIVMGLSLYPQFPKSEEPAITIRTAVVTAGFPGLSPVRLEQLIAEPIERKIRQLAEVDEIETLIITGKATINVTLHDQYTDLDGIWQELRDKMEEVARELPAGTVGPFVNTDFGDVTMASIALSAEGFTYAEMESTAEELQRHLYSIEGVGKVQFYGVQKEQVWLEFDAKRLAAVGVQLPTLIDDLRAQNIILPAGQLNAAGTSFLLEATGEFKSVAEIEALLTKVGGLDRFVRLADIVSVRRGYADPPQIQAFYNGRPVIVVAVEMQTGFDILDVGDAVKRRVHEFERGLPIGYALDLVTFQPKEVARSINNALLNVAETVLVVLLVVMVFLGLRTGFIIATIVPFAVLFALIGMRLLGIALEQVSIAAVIISLGLLVDNGVVIVEDMLRQLQNGTQPQEAALRTGRQLSVPLMIASATTVFAFIPFFLLEGPEGEYAFSLGTVVTLTLIGSWISAIYVLPMVASKWIRVKTTSTNSKVSIWTTRYRRLLETLLPRAGWVLLVAYAAVFVGIMVMVAVPKQLFPSSDRGEVLIYMDMPKGTDISRTTQVAQRVTDWIDLEQVNPEVENQLLYVGDGGPRFYLSLDPADRSPTSAFLLVNTLNRVDADAFLKRARRHFYTNFPEARFRIKRLAMGAKESGVIDVEITGPDLDRLLQLGGAVEELFYGTPALVENQHDWGDKIVKVVIDVDQNRARRLGISSDSLARVLGAYFDGYQISGFRESDESIPIVLRAMEKDRNSLEDIANISVLGRSGQVVPLDQVAESHPELEFSQIRRKDQQRTITVTAKSDALTSGELFEKVDDKLNTLDLTGGYQLSIGGELADSSEIYQKLAAGLPAAFLLMLLVIIYQFNSFRRALIVFMTVPLVLIGAPLGLLASGQPLSFMAILGLISLAGVIINNGIVLIDQIDIEREAENLPTAILNAAGQRIRPILLTSVTTVLGLVPLFLFGGPLWQPLAAVIIGGLCVASVLTLIFVPAAYYLLQPAENHITIDENYE